MELPVCIITGANGALGLSTTKKTIQLGYGVIMACRNEEATITAIDQIKEENHSAAVSYMHLNLANMQSIEQFANDFMATDKNLKVLINNAGVFPKRGNKSPQFTEDGFENTFGVNHLGHFYLTLLLLERLKICSPSRIIMVSSKLHDPAQVPGKRKPHLDFDNLQLLDTNTFDSLIAYSNSKLANILFTKELNRKLIGTGVTVNAVCPGWMPTTNLEDRSACKKCFLICCLHHCCRCRRITRTLKEGTDCLVFVATDPSLIDESGNYYMDCEVVETSEESNNIEVAEQLWQVSMELLNLPSNSRARLVLYSL